MRMGCIAIMQPCNKSQTKNVSNLYQLVSNNRSMELLYVENNGECSTFLDVENSNSDTI